MQARLAPLERPGSCRLLLTRHPVFGGSEQEVLERDAVATHQKAAIRREGVAEGRQAREGVAGAAALDLDGGEEATCTDHEIDLAVAIAPVAELPAGHRDGVGQVRPERAVSRAVLRTWSLGLEPRLRTAWLAYLGRPTTMPAPPSRSR